MRRTVLVLVFLMVVASVGFLLAGVGISPVAAAALGIFTVCAVVATRTSTERLLWLTSCLFVLTVTWNGIRFGGGAFGNTFLALAVFALIVHAAVTHRAPVVPPWLLLAGSGLLLAQVLSLVFVPNVELTNKSDIQFISLYPTPEYIPHRADVAAMIKFEVALVLVPVLMLAAGTTRARCSRLLDLFAVSAVVSAVVGVVDYAGVPIGPTPLLADQRASGLAIHPNYLALGCTIAVPLTMMWLARSDVRWRLAGLFAVPALLGGVMASGSRAGAVTAMTGVLVTTAVTPRLRRSLTIVLPLVGMAAVVVLVYTSLGHLLLEQVRLTHGSDVAGSNFQRRYAADVAIDQIRARPLQGVGFSVIADAHDIYLEILAAGGLIALASFLVFLGGTAASVLRGLRGPQRPEVVAASLAVLLWLAGGVVGNELADKFLYVVPGLLLALARVKTRVPDGDALGSLATAGPGPSPAHGRDTDYPTRGLPPRVTVPA